MPSDLAHGSTSLSDSGMAGRPAAYSPAGDEPIVAQRHSRMAPNGRRDRPRLARIVE
jgi:hypothetical protein